MIKSQNWVKRLSWISLSLILLNFKVNVILVIFYYHWNSEIRIRHFHNCVIVDEQLKILTIHCSF